MKRRLVFLLTAIAWIQCTPAARTPALSNLSVLQALADSGKELPRPRLPAGSDTNAALAYYDFGTRWNAPTDTAEMSLFWASRIDPSWAEPLYARLFNTLQALEHDMYETYWKTYSPRAVSNVSLTPRQTQVIDSLQQLAWQINPFLFSDLEFRHGVPGRWGDTVHDAWLAYSQKRFAVADTLFAALLKKHPRAVELRLMRAKALFYLGKFDSTVAELQAARDTVNQDVAKKLSPILPSVEMFDFAIGIARVQQDDFPSARAAFERALTQNLAFYWAHTRLAGSALELHDTATALAELEMATQLEGRDPVLRLYRGVVLQTAGRFADAELDLQKAIELDPYYAEPYYFLATNRQALGDTVSAIGYYRQFLRRAARAHPYRPQTAQQLRALGVRPDSM
jgi:tetratricopeptide (TPR) repeat protein